MLSRIVRSHHRSARLRSCTNVSNMNNAAIGSLFNNSRRHISAEGAVEPAHSPYPPCVARMFDRTKGKGDEHIIPANSQGGNSGDNPSFNPVVGTPAPPDILTAEPEELERLKEEHTEPDFWRNIAPYKDVSAKEFLSWGWCKKVRQIS